MESFSNSSSEKYPTAAACIEAASVVNCHDLHDVMDAINNLDLGYKKNHPCYRMFWPYMQEVTIVTIEMAIGK